MPWEKVLTSCVVPRLLQSLRRYLSALLMTSQSTKRFLSSKGSHDLLLLLLSLSRRIVSFVSDEKSALLFCHLLLPFLTLKSISDDVKAEVYGLFSQFISQITAPSEFVRPIVFLFENIKSYVLRQKLCEILLKLQAALGPQHLTIGLSFCLLMSLSPFSFFHLIFNSFTYVFLFLKIAKFIKDINMQVSGKLGEYDGVAHQTAFTSSSLDFMRFTFYDHICFVANFFFFLSANDSLIRQNAVDSLRSWMEFCSKEREEELKEESEKAFGHGGATSAMRTHIAETANSDRKIIELKKKKKQRAQEKKKTMKESQTTEQIDNKMKSVEEKKEREMSVVSWRRLFKLQTSFLLSAIKRAIRSPQTDKKSWIEEKRGYLETLSFHFLSNSHSYGSWGPHIANESDGFLPLLLDIQIFQKMKALRKLKRLFQHTFPSQMENASLLTTHQTEENASEENDEEEQEEAEVRENKEATDPHVSAPSPYLVLNFFVPILLNMTLQTLGERDSKGREHLLIEGAAKALGAISLSLSWRDYEKV